MEHISLGYKLLDSGEGEKLEQYGQYILRRPDPQALWRKQQEKELWMHADASFARSGGSAKWMKKKTSHPPENAELQL